MTKTLMNDWIEANPIKNTMSWKDAALAQYERWKSLFQGIGCDFGVEGQHRSKSVPLPVVSYEFRDIGLKFVFRDNFYNIKMSVLSEKPLDVDLVGLCFTSPPPDPGYTGNPLAPQYFEGFPASLIFDYYDTSNHKEWSMDFGHMDLALFASGIILRAAGAFLPFVWDVRA